MSSINFSGIASGIDGNAIIQATLDAQKTAWLPLQNKVKGNEEENKAFDELNARLLTLNDKIKDFLTLAGNAVSKTASSSNENAIVAVAGANALCSSSTLKVLNMARNATVSFSDQFSSLTQPIAPGLSAPITIAITCGQGSSTSVLNVEVDSDTTLSQLLSRINETSSGQVRASAINTGTASNPEYTLVINGTSTGLEKGSISVEIPSELAATGLFQSSTISQAQDAVLEISGIGQVSRPSNQISDLLPGLSLNIKQENTGPVTISVAGDTEKTAMKVAALVDALNDVIKYSRDNSSVKREDKDNEATNVFGTLARTRVDEGVISDIRNAIASSASGPNNSKVHILADLGITTQKDGTFKFDKDVFMKAAADDTNAAEGVLHRFADKVGSADGIIYQYTKYQGMLDRAKEANNQENSQLSDRLSRLQESLDQQREMLTKMFARLESTVGRLNSEAQAITSMITGLAAQR